LYERSLGGLYEHLDDTVRRSAGRVDWRLYSIPRSRRLIHLLLVFAVISLILHFVTELAQLEPRLRLIPYLQGVNRQEESLPTGVRNAASSRLRF